MRVKNATHYKGTESLISRFSEHYEKCSEKRQIQWRSA